MMTPIHNYTRKYNIVTKVKYNFMKHTNHYLLRGYYDTVKSLQKDTSFGTLL